MQIEIERQHQLDFDEDLLDEVEFQGGLPGPIMTALNTKKGMVLSKPKRHGQLDEFERLDIEGISMLLMLKLLAMSLLLPHSPLPVPLILPPLNFSAESRTRATNWIGLQGVMRCDSTMNVQR